MWTPTTRQQHSRPVTRYQTDLTDAEWRVIVPHSAEALRNGPAAGLADARDRQRHLLFSNSWISHGHGSGQRSQHRQTAAAAAASVRYSALIRINVPSTVVNKMQDEV